MEWARVSAIGVVSLLAAMSPGPDFALVTKNCLKGTFRSGVFTALGVTSALFIHVAYCLFGIALLIQESPLLFNALKYLGAGYLFYLGILLLKEKMSPEGSEEIAKKQMRKKQRPFLSGFLCNLLNPKATLFILSIFTQFIDPQMNGIEKTLLGSVFGVVVFIWFVFLSYLITHRFLQKHFIKVQALITRVMGVALIVLAGYVAFFS